MSASSEGGRRHFAALALAFVGFVTSALAAAVFTLARLVIRVRQRPRFPHRLLAVGNGEVVLSRDEETGRPGIYGLSWPGGHGVVGTPVRADTAIVVRPLLQVHHGDPAPGGCRMDHVHIGTPMSALSLDYVEVHLDSEVGPLRAWSIPGKADDAWVVVGHGYGGSLQSALSFLPMLHDAAYNVVVVSYRNDPGEPTSPDGHYHLGASEWRDFDAGIAYAVAHGATRLALYGWSMGGAIALQALAQSPHRDKIHAVILDSPVLDWRRVLRHLGARSHVPAPLVHLASRLIEHRLRIDLDAFDWLQRSPELSVPILCFHGEGDTTVPASLSKDLAERRPDLVELAIEPGAGHVGSFNLDRERYARRVQDFLGERLPVSID